MSKRWSYKVGETHSGDRVRVYERAGSANLYIATWDAAIEGYRRRSLEHADRDRAKAEAEEASRELRETRERAQDGIVRRGPAALGEALTMYLELRSPHHVEREQEADRRRAELWTRFCGAKRIDALSTADWDRFTLQRGSGAIDSRGNPIPEGERRPVKSSTVRADMLWLRWALNWACSVKRPDGSPLCETNPVPEPKAPAMPDKAKNPKQPVMTQATLDALLDAADEDTRALLIVANGTGRRISAICSLRWGSVNLEPGVGSPHGSILWPRDTDKQGREWWAPINATVAELLSERRAALPELPADDAPIFPAPRSEGCMTRHLADKWLRRATRDAGVELRPGEGWHSLRRKWANDRKGYPLKDVAKAGGWSSTAALEACYLQTDAATMLAVVEADSTQSTGHSGRADSQEAA